VLEFKSVAAIVPGALSGNKCNCLRLNLVDEVEGGFFYYY